MERFESELPTWAHRNDGKRFIVSGDANCQIGLKNSLRQLCRRHWYHLTASGRLVERQNFFRRSARSGTTELLIEREVKIKKIGALATRICLIENNGNFEHACGESDAKK